MPTMVDVDQYKSALTPQQVDTALKNMSDTEKVLQTAQGYAEQAKQYAASVNPQRVSPLVGNGNPANVEGTMSAALWGLVINGGAVQSGTPAPDSQAAIAVPGSSGTIPVTVSNKNLVLGAYYSPASSDYGTLITVTGGLVCDIPAGIKITCSVTLTASSATKAYWNNNYFGTGTTTDISVNPGTHRYSSEITLQQTLSGALTGRIALSKSKTGDGVEIKPSNLMISFSQDTGYTANEKSTITTQTPNGLPGIPVSSGGNYTDENGQQWVCDTIDFFRGVKTQRVGVLTFNSSSGLAKSGTNVNDAYYFSRALSNLAPAASGYDVNTGLGYQYAIGLCNYFEIASSGVYATSVIGFDIANIEDNGYCNIRFGFGKGNMSTLAQAQQWFDSHTLTVYYPLAEPIETAIDDGVMQQFADAQSYDGSTLAVTAEPVSGIALSAVGAGVQGGYAERILTAVQQSALLDLVYPVGSIYMSANATSPASFLGGSWERIQGRFLLAASSSYTAGSTGGEATHTLTEAELPEISGSFGGTSSGNAWGVLGTSSGVFSRSEPIPAPTNTEKSSTNTRNATVNMSFGSGQAHNNMPPYLAVYVWKRTA